MDQNTLLIIFVALTGVSVLLQAAILLGIFLSLRKTAQSVLAVTEDLKGTVVPMVASTRELLDRIGPQLITVTSDLAELTQGIRKQSTGVHVSISEIMERVSRQTSHIDALLTSALNSVEHAGAVIESTVAAPVRQVSGIFAAIKAVIDTYKRTDPRQSPTRPTHSPADRDMFI